MNKLHSLFSVGLIFVTIGFSASAQPQPSEGKAKPTEIRSVPLNEPANLKNVSNIENVLASADNLSSSMPTGAPLAIEIDRVMVTGSGRAYFNHFPGTENVPPGACRTQGNFVVSITLHVPDSHVRKQLSADRVWVYQETRKWNAGILDSDITKADFHGREDEIRILARDCDAPFAINKHEDEIGPRKSRANIVIELLYKGGRSLLRLPDAWIGAVS